MSKNKFVNKAMTTIIISVGLMTSGYLFNTDNSTIVNGQLVENETVEISANDNNMVDVSKNVGNGLTYMYSITEVKDNEVYGIPLNHENEGNKGIFLYQSELSFVADEGDKIAVVWGQYEDEFLSIEKVYNK